MARNFGGSTSTDRISFASVAVIPTRSFSIWFNANTRDTTARRFWDWADAADGDSVFQWSSTVIMEYQALWSSVNGAWRPDAAASTDTWHNLVITYDGTATTNDAAFYIDGSLVASTQQGADPSVTIDSGNRTWNVGNRGAGDRSFDGELAELAQWNRIITQDEITALANRFSPLFFTSGLVFYARLTGTNSPERDEISGKIGTLTGTTFAEHPAIIYPGSGANLLLMNVG